MHCLLVQLNSFSVCSVQFCCFVVVQWVVYSRALCSCIAVLLCSCAIVYLCSCAVVKLCTAVIRDLECSYTDVKFVRYICGMWSCSVYYMPTFCFMYSVRCANKVQCTIYSLPGIHHRFSCKFLGALNFSLNRSLGQFSPSGQSDYPWACLLGKNSDNRVAFPLFVPHLQGLKCILYA